MKKLLFALAIIIASCSIGTASMNVDTDNNTYIDIAYGGTNSNTAAGARANLDVYSKAETDAADDTGTDDQTASEVNVADTGGYYSGSTVEAILAEIHPQLGGFDEAGNYTFTGTFDSSDGTVILPLLTPDPYDSGWNGSYKFVDQDSIYDEVELKADKSDLASQAAFEAAFFALPSGGGTSATIGTSDPTSSSSTGFYGNTSDGGFFYKSDDGIFDIVAGTYTPDPAGAECDGFDICQNFEGTGYDNGETWTGTDVDEDYAGAYVIRGSQSLEVQLDSSVPSAKVSFTSSGEEWVHFSWSTNFDPSGVYQNILAVRDAADSENVYLVQFNGSNVRLTNGSTSGTGAYSISSDETDYHFWLHLDATNKAGDLYVGTSATTRPGSAVASMSGGSATSTTVGILNFTGPSYRVAGSHYIVEQVMADSTEFTTVSE